VSFLLTNFQHGGVCGGESRRRHGGPGRTGLLRLTKRRVSNNIAHTKVDLNSSLSSRAAFDDSDGIVRRDNLDIQVAGGALVGQPLHVAVRSVRETGGFPQEDQLRSCLNE